MPARGATTGGRPYKRACRNYRPKPVLPKGDSVRLIPLGEFARLNFPEEWPPERRAQLCAQRDAAKTEGKKPGRKEGKKGRRKTRRGES